MKIQIHRGARQIGGCITEIATEGCRILIDLGSNLPGNSPDGADGDRAEELTKAEVEKLTDGVDALFYTHYHGDHVGLLPWVPPHIPQYIGAGAREVMQCKYAYLHQEETLQAIGRMRTYAVARRIDVGGKGKLFVTPYFVSHSAFDAYMFKIECEGRTILHTGDFRSHGYLGKGLEPTLLGHVGRVDILITEGTMLGRQTESVWKEADIKDNVIDLLKKHKYVFALCSSTDLDRLASFHQACKETGRLFCVDRYQQHVLDIFTRYAGQRQKLFCFDKICLLGDDKTGNLWYKMRRQGFLMPVRVSHSSLVKALLCKYADDPAWLIYSLWRGYAEHGKPYSNERIRELRELFGDRIADGTRDGFHTSGHADVATLRKVCEIVNPRIGVIPIHKERNTSYREILHTDAWHIFTESETLIEHPLGNIAVLLS